MDMMNNGVKLAPDQALCEIRDEIQRLLQARTLRTKPYGESFVELWELTCEFLTGGKLVRPKLLLGAFDALAGDYAHDESTRAAALDIAAALELLHYAFLLHDDVIDEDLIRRGKPNLIGHLAADLSESGAHGDGNPWGSSRRLHWARSSGILMGDLMLTIAHQAFARVRLAEPSRLRILDLLDAAVTETVAGEFLDVSLGASRITPDLSLVLDMTRMKTAAYTFELPLRAACVLAGADQRIEHHLGQAGRHLGLAFQLQDDLLSAFGAAEIHGKDEFSDFRERKETVLIAYARMTSGWPNCEQLLAADAFTTETGRSIQRLLHSCGAREFVESMIDEQIRAALTLLTDEERNIPPAVAAFILTFVDALEGRKL